MSATTKTPAEQLERAQPFDVERERTAFEAWISGSGRAHMLKRGCRLGDYEDLTVTAWWAAWLERAKLAAATAAQPPTERATFDRAMKETWQMCDPLRPPGAPGSYARGEHNGIVAALRAVRQNYERVSIAAQAEALIAQQAHKVDAAGGAQA